jgi:hypothetical protein
MKDKHGLDEIALSYLNLQSPGIGTTFFLVSDTIEVLVCG